MSVIQLQNLNVVNDFQIIKSNLNPAIQYMRARLTEKVNIEDLAKGCRMGITQFFNHFKEQFGKWPLELPIIFKDRKC